MSSMAGARTSWTACGSWARTSWARFPVMRPVGCASRRSCSIRVRGDGPTGGRPVAIPAWPARPCRPARCGIWRCIRRSFRSRSGRSFESKMGEKGPVVWEVKHASFYRKQGRAGLPGPADTLIVARNVLDPEGDQVLPVQPGPRRPDGHARMAAVGGVLSFAD